MKKIAIFNLAVSSLFLGYTWWMVYEAIAEHQAFDGFVAFASILTAFTLLIALLTFVSVLKKQKRYIIMYIFWGFINVILSYFVTLLFIYTNFAYIISFGTLIAQLIATLIYIFRRPTSKTIN